ncbi:angiopoietin-related protein 3-like isoform X2 [Drosophila sulfurigaster albostrigata]|uniref:angiopoietin-related protein 3-like isoform X2 n=1 Tax=Drosophila sulfurigaster albostrigata TaxID=89887 RepID=UPI002D21C249|nr:angiopoietin-related protein 3-like isoform X2 [Drosophila sulfurigaster albostrigata]
MQICHKLFAVLLLIVSIWKVSSGSIKSNGEDQQNEIIAGKTVDTEEKIKFLVNRITKANQQLEDYKEIIKNLQNEVSKQQEENEKLKSQLQKNTNELKYTEDELGQCQRNYTVFLKLFKEEWDAYEDDQERIFETCQKYLEAHKTLREKSENNHKLLETNFESLRNETSYKDATINELKKGLAECELRYKEQNQTNKDEVASNNSTSKNADISESTTISKSLPSSCVNMTAGIQEIQIGNAKPFKAMCDGDGWMIIQRRINGTEDFNRTWKEYEDGFGDLNEEFWFGLEKIHLATNSTRQRLNMTIRSGWGADPFVIHFDDFRIGNSESFYKLESIGNYTEDWHTRNETLLKNNVNNAFSTYDANHNGNPELNCASYGAGGFWFSFDCLDYNMNEPTNGYWTSVVKLRPYSD